MLDKGAATENEMILEFLSAECPKDDRVRYSRLSDERGNEERRSLLGSLRGFGRNAGLFEDFPQQVEWQRYELSARELGAAMYIRQGKWVDLSRGTRLVADGAANLDLQADIASKVNAITKSIGAAAALPRLIAVRERDGRANILLKGQHRATALVQAGCGIEVIIGTHAEMWKWRWY